MQKKPDSQFGAYRNPAPRSRMKPVVLLSLLLWFLIWGGYNITIGHVLSPNFPANHLDLVQGMRVFLPLLAGWIALLVLLVKRNLKAQAVAGPLGLLAIFGAVGAVSSALYSPYPVRAVCWSGEFGAVILVLMVVLSDQEASPILSRLITLNWIIDICLLIAVLGAIPFLGGAAVTSTQGSPLGQVAYHGAITAHGRLLDMATSRNTGLGRYAGVAGLVALARLLEGRKWPRLAWLGVLLLALYTLVFAQARTETLSFAAGLLLLLLLRKRRRIVMMAMGALGVALLALVGFFNAAWNFGTRDRGFDPTLTGRTYIWSQAMSFIRQSPWVGLGFRADRYFVHQDMQNSLLHALIEAGVLGTIAYVAAFGVAWYLVARLYVSRRSDSLPSEIPAILMFFTVMSVTESAAWYTANWLLLAPVLAYIQVAAWQEKALRAKASYRRREALQVARAAYAMERRNASEAPNMGLN